MLIWSKTGVEFLARYGHILAGVTWIGLLYYFNFVQGPFVNKDASAEAKSDVSRFLLPRALWWFRWAAALTFLSGLSLLGLMNETRIPDGGDMAWWYKFSEGNLILLGALIATIMFLNVWLVIWPKQKIVIANALATADGKPANPEAPKSARRAFLASRTNTLFSISAVFFMAAAPHLYFVVETGSSRMIFWLVAIALVALIELNALTATDGPTTKYLEKHRDTIIAGFVLVVILYAAVELLLRV